MKTKISLLVVGMFLAATSSALATVRYVNVNKANPTPPYTNWATAATNIQDAVDVAGAGDEIVVTNGTYAPVSVNTPLTLQSVNGSGLTVIDGGGAATCVYLTDDAVMVGFTLTNGFGGVYCESTNAVLTNCVLTGNFGGGAADCTLNNCTLTGNSANYGGGAAYCTLNNCTLTGNSAVYFGGGAYSCALNNCIVYFNSDPSDGGNYGPYSTLNYCCTTPLPTSGVGNISADPELADTEHLSAGSPCRGAGNPAYASGTDIDGEPWANPPSIGCDEFYAGAINGPLSVAILASYTNVATGFAVCFSEHILGHASASSWDFGDGTVVSNRPYASHAWTVTGDYPVTLRAYNDTYPAGVAASVTLHVMAQPVYYVALSSTSPVAPYSSWATAANNIQDAVDAASLPGALVLVTNGTYAGSIWVVDPDGNLNCVVVDKPLVLSSVNGPNVTVIDGRGAVRCLYLANNTVMVGFTLTNGAVVYYYGKNEYGGGVYCESASTALTNCVLTGNSAIEGGGACGCTLNNCTLTSNSADFGGGVWLCTLNNCTLTGNSAGSGGGAAGCTLNNCTFTGNSAVYFGGGASGGAFFGSCTLNNCTLTGNSASDNGGGAYGGTLNNCIVYFNTDTNGGNYDSSSTLNYCCTTPMPTNGVGNITNDPAFVNAAAGNYHLSSGSPCINAGNNAYVVGSTDLDGRPRIIGGTADMGAYEYRALLVWSGSQSPVSPYATWATAATNIQDAVDAAIVGDEIIVTNGTYATGSRTGHGVTTSRVVVNKPLTVQSVNGPQATLINGGGAVECVYLTNGATLSGFTLTNGWVSAKFAEGPGGGVYCESSSAVLSNCTLVGNSISGNQGNAGGAYGGTLINCTLTGNAADGNGGGAYNCTLINCTLTGNSAVGYNLTGSSGGGGYSCTLNNCTLTGNSAYCGGGAASSTLDNCTLTGNLGDGRFNGTAFGGGAYFCTLNNCTLANNSLTGSYSMGGGAEGCTLNNCTLTGNSAPGSFGLGGGACGGTLNNCTLTNNSATGFNGGGGGAYGGTLNNCTLTGNSGSHGGGALGDTLNNCTLTGNSAEFGGGANGCTLNNCIVYYNTAPAGSNFYNGTLNYCCMTPQPTNGFGNITNAPLFVDYAGGNLRLQSNSPCINSGNNTYVVGSTDLDGNPRIVGGTVDIGAYEYQTPTSIISYAWLQQYSLPTDGSADHADLDHDGLNNWQEYLADTSPLDANDYLHITSFSRSGTYNTLWWTSKSTRLYQVERRASFDADSPWETIITNAAPGWNNVGFDNMGPQYFYRIRAVQP